MEPEMFRLVRDLGAATERLGRMLSSRTVFMRSRTAPAMVRVSADVGGAILDAVTALEEGVRALRGWGAPPASGINEIAAAVEALRVACLGTPVPTQPRDSIVIDIGAILRDRAKRKPPRR